jgi:hypothetical protein
MSSTPVSIPPAASWLAHLRPEAERFAQVVAQSPLQVHVPAYPDFTVHSLAAHIGRAPSGCRLRTRRPPGAPRSATGAW